MDKIFLQLLNRSICAGWLILAVIVLRQILRRAPKWIRCVLWAFVAVRLVCPFSLQSMFSLIPSARTLSPYDVQYAKAPEIHSGVAAIDNTLNPVIRESFTPDPAASIDPLHVWTAAAGIVWLIGLLFLTGYALLSYIRLRKHVSESVCLRQNIYLCDNVRSPFILGVLRPAIYLPADLEEDAMQYILAHEQAHIARRDHWWKLLGFFLLCAYWFHPLVWAAYILFCRDMELACDEKAVKNWNFAGKKAYSHALVSCSAQRRAILSCPLAFGEVGVRERVKAVLHYKKPALWVITVSAVICALVAVCFLTDPVGEAKEPDSQGGGNPQTETPSTEGEVPRTNDPVTKTAIAPDHAQPEAGNTTAPRSPDEESTSHEADGTTGTQTGSADNSDAPSENRDSGTQSSDPSEGIPAAGTGYPLYDSLIAAAARVLKNPQAEAYDDERTLFTSAYFYSDMTWQTPGYLLKDLDGNGTDELLFGENHDDGWNGIVYNIYTISDGALVHVADGWERNRYYLCENGYIANEGSGGASESTYCYYTYEGTKLTLVEAVVYDASSDPENPWFYTTEEPFSETASLTPVSEADARAIMDSYTYILPQFTPFSGAH